MFNSWGTSWGGTSGSPANIVCLYGVVDADSTLGCSSILLSDVSSSSNCTTSISGDAIFVSGDTIEFNVDTSVSSSVVFNAVHTSSIAVSSTTTEGSSFDVVYLTSDISTTASLAGDALIQWVVSGQIGSGDCCLTPDVIADAVWSKVLP